MAALIRTYSELTTLPTFEERFDYLNLSGKVGAETFGFDRVFNQKFYRSAEWIKMRDYVINRDLGCDLGVVGYDIIGKIYIHHMNPISMSDIKERTKYLLDPEFLITMSFQTHNAIHYGDKSQVGRKHIERRPNDTCPWK